MLLHSLVLAALLLASESVAQSYDYDGAQTTKGGESCTSMSTSMPVAISAPGSSTAASSTATTLPTVSAIKGPAPILTAGSSSPTSGSGTGPPQVQVVQVSDKTGTLKFFPESLQAAPGSLVQFQFYPKNHTVTQSTFAQPCIPINQVMSNVTGLKSGFMPVAATDTQMPLYTVVINDTSPVWIYCGQPGHCQKGMVMVINEKAGSGKNLTAYKALAAAGNATVPSNSSAGAGAGITTSYTTTVVTASASASTGTTASRSGAVGVSSVSGLGSFTTSSAPAQQTANAAVQDVVSFSGLAGLLLAGLALVL